MSQLERTKQLQHWHHAQDIISKRSKGFSRIFWHRIHAKWSHLHIFLFQSIPSICPWFLIVFQSWQCWSNSKLLYFMHEKHWKAGDANHQCIMSSMKLHTSLFCQHLRLRVHAVAPIETSGKQALEFLQIASKPPRGGCDCLKKESSETTNIYKSARVKLTFNAIFELLLPFCKFYNIIHPISWCSVQAFTSTHFWPVLLRHDVICVKYVKILCQDMFSMF